MVKKYTNFDSQLGDSAVELTDRAKLSLYKKSQNSGISVDILEEVYRRGYRCWTEVFGGTQDSFAFDRVNSFIAGGFAAQLDEDLRNWFNPKHPEGGWKRIDSKGNVVGPCAREPGEPKPKCMSNEKRSKLTQKERAAAVAAKRRHDPVADRSVKGGKPVNVSNFGKGKISEDYLEEKNTPTNPSLWSKAKLLARSKFDVYPSAYANGWAAKWYKSKGGGWKSVSEENIEEKCWDNYKQVGMKKKGNRMVPNCVPVKEDEELNKPIMTPGQLAKKHGKTINTINKALKKGTKVEGEHTTDKDEAKRIASAHIGEKPDYYTKLDKAGLEEKITQEPHSKDKKKSASRFDASDELVSIYKHDTPGQSMKEETLEIIKRIIREQLEENIVEATYKGKKVPLNKPMKGDVKKSKVFVDPDGDGKAQKVNFGDKNLSIKKHIPARKKSYCARSGGQGNLTDKTSANYWSRRAWNCEETIDELSVPAGTTGKRKTVSTPLVPIRMADGSIKRLPPGKSGSSGGGGDE
jgi:hypothetical protein